METKLFGLALIAIGIGLMLIAGVATLVSPMLVMAFDAPGSTSSWPPYVCIGIYGLTTVVCWAAGPWFVVNGLEQFSGDE